MIKAYSQDYYSANFTWDEYGAWLEDNLSTCKNYLLRRILEDGLSPSNFTTELTFKVRHWDIQFTMRAIPL